MKKKQKTETQRKPRRKNKDEKVEAQRETNNDETRYGIKKKQIPKEKKNERRKKKNQIYQHGGLGNERSFVGSYIQP